MAGIVHADPWLPDDRDGFGLERRSDVEIATEQIVGVKALVNAHGLAEKTRPLGSFLDILDRFDGAQQDGGAVAFALGHDVHAVVHPVNQVHVRVTGRTEHHPGPLGQPFG